MSRYSIIDSKLVRTIIETYAVIHNTSGVPVITFMLSERITKVGDKFKDRLIGPSKFGDFNTPMSIVIDDKQTPKDALKESSCIQRKIRTHKVIKTTIMAKIISISIVILYPLIVTIVLKVTSPHICNNNIGMDNTNVSLIKRANIITMTGKNIEYNIVIETILDISKLKT